MTFLMTDVEGSTRAWEDQPRAMAEAMARHDAIVGAAVDAHHGRMPRSRGEGDGTFSFFVSAADAVAAAVAVQRALTAERWPGGLRLRVRMALHTGLASERDDDLYGPPVNLCARLRGAANGGQVVAAVDVLTAAGALPDGISAVDLGVHRLRDVRQPQQVFQLAAPGLGGSFPPLASLDPRRHELPSPPTDLIGRDDDLAEILAMLDGGTRLLTLVGPPGVGKSRLALEVAHVRLSRADAAWFVSLTGERFDGVIDLAEVLPTTWVPDLLGWPADGRDHLLEWAGATFDGLGPMNDRATAAGDAIFEMSAYAQRLAAMSLPEHCFAARILQAADRGEVSRRRCPQLFVDYLGPSLDTTISAIGNALWLLACHPDQWARLRAEPHRVKAAFNEALRLESPISSFSRVARVDAEIAGVTIDAGARVLVSFASANRDERRWPDPERFDVTRESAGHLAFGHGEHACVGMGLARIEGVAVLGALVERVAEIRLTAEPVRKLNNLIRSFASLPLEVTPA